MKICSRIRQGLGCFHHLESVTILCACEERAPWENVGSKKAPVSSTHGYLQG
jgi:hypothetical protein